MGSKWSMAPTRSSTRGKRTASPDSPRRVMSSARFRPKARTRISSQRGRLRHRQPPQRRRALALAPCRRGPRAPPRRLLPAHRGDLELPRARRGLRRAGAARARARAGRHRRRPRRPARLPGPVRAGRRGRGAAVPRRRLRPRLLELGRRAHRARAARALRRRAAPRRPGLVRADAGHRLPARPPLPAAVRALAAGARCAAPTGAWAPAATGRRSTSCAAPRWRACSAPRAPSAWAPWSRAGSRSAAGSKPGRGGSRRRRRRRRRT